MQSEIKVLERSIKLEVSPEVIRQQITKLEKSIEEHEKEIV